MATQTQANMNSLADSINTMTDAYLALTEQCDRIETALNRPMLGGNGGKPVNSAERERFATFLRNGPEALSVPDRQAMIVGDDSKGGYLAAPADFVAEILRNVLQFSPVRQAARVANTSTGEVLIPKRTGTLTGRWVGETETRVGTEPSYGQLSIPIHTAACYVDISMQMIEDAAVDIASEIAFDLGQEFGRMEGAAFVSGNGVKQPFGFMADATIPTVKSGDATKITADSLIDAFYALAPFYRNQSTWMLNSTSVAAVRKLKDKNDQYLWQPGLAAGQPPMLLGRPCVEAIDMPGIEAGAAPVVLGDFQNGYRIYDRLSLALLRDNFSQQVQGLCRFHARRRVGGGVAMPEAFVKVVVGTS